MTSDQEEHIRVLWEDTPMSSAKIAAQFGVTKNAIIGVANRRKWIKFEVAGRGSSRNKRRRIETMTDRLAALHAKLDRVLAETAPAIRAAEQVAADV